MKRRIIVTLIGILLSLPVIAFPEGSAFARSINFVQNGIQWAVKISVCQNGIKVDVTGGTVSGAITELRIDQINKIVPDAKVYYYYQALPVAFTSPSGTNLIASAITPEIPIVATGVFYFQEGQPVRTHIQTVISGWVNGTPFTIAGATGSDLVQRCILPATRPTDVDLSGVYNPTALWRGDYAMDGRASPEARDKVAIYCINEGASAGTIFVAGVDKDLKAFPLGAFKLNDLYQASPRGISRVADDKHSIILMQYNNDHYHFEWVGGPWSPREIKDFACDWYGKNRYNKTSSQLTYPDAFGNDGRVAPNQTDKMVVYCNIGPRTIVVMGIDASSRGFDLATFQYEDLLQASPKPITVDTKQNGKVALRVDSDDNFYLEWFNGPWSPYETKGFKCRF